MIIMCDQLMLGGNHIVIYKCIKLTCDRKAFLSEQCKEIEEYNRIGRTRDTFKKIGDTKGTVHAEWHNKGQKWQGPNRSRRD